MCQDQGTELKLADSVMPDIKQLSLDLSKDVVGYLHPSSVSVTEETNTGKQLQAPPLMNILPSFNREDALLSCLEADVPTRREPDHVQQQQQQQKQPEAVIEPDEPGVSQRFSKLFQIV